MDDPNGFSVYQGKVHLFYQFYPYKTEFRRDSFSFTD
nr:hypothetical protein [uncultured Dorea sp.]